jgi:hypothetical protein
LRKHDFPVMMWCGREDGLHDTVQAFTAAETLPFLSSSGDHMAAVLQPDAVTLKRIRGFVDAAAASGRHRRSN